MRINKIKESNIATHFEELAKIGNLGPRLEDGFLRAGWSDEESSAMQYIIQYAEKKNLVHEFDAVGNLFIRVPGKWKEVLQVGSHLDTVPRGGLFDGGAGIVAGLEAILAVRDSIKNLKRGMELIIWRCEESGTYQALYMGSNAAFGKANSDFLNNTFENTKLRDAIKSQGFDVSPIEQNQPTISQEYIDRISAHIELHIEQARRLEIDKKDIGIVTSIRAPRRYRVIIKGESAHSGATPMDVKYRKDAALTMSYMQVRLNERLKSYIAKGADLVQTFGVVNNDKSFNEKMPLIYKSAITKVSELAYFLMDIRGNNKESLDQYVKDVFKIIKDTSSEFGTFVEIETLAESDPIESLSLELQDAIEESCKSLDYSYIKLSSGAGHDAAVVAKQCKSDNTKIPTAMIFIPCLNGISHNPLEFTTNEAVAKGAQVIAETLAKYQE